jgi:hypothetical protein
MYQEHGKIHTEYIEYHPRHFSLNIQESNSGYIYEVIVTGRYQWQKIIYLFLTCGYSSYLIQCLAQPEIIYLLMVYLIMLSAAKMRI